MNARPARQTGRLRGWWPLILAAGIYAVVIAATVSVRTWDALDTDDYAAVRAATTSDFRDFWWTARHFRETGQLTTEFGVHNYLPFFTIFMLPWSFLPLPIAAVAFSLLSLGLFGVTVVMAENLLCDGVGARPRAALLVALGLALPYVHSCLVLGNVGLLLVFLVVTTWLLVERGREWEAGVALGLAALIKLLPGLLIVFFLLKRRWRVAGAAAAVTLVLGFGLPLLTIGAAQTTAQHKAFCQGAIQDHSAQRTITSERPIKAMYGNNSVPIVLRRLLSPVNAGADDPDKQLYVNVADLPRGVILAIYVVLMLALLGVSVAVTLRPPRGWPPASIHAGRVLRAQFATWCCLMLLASPLVWTHYLPLAYWPLALLADRAERQRRATRHLDWLSLFGLGLWLLGAILLAWPAARAAGAQIAAVAGLWLAMIIVACKRETARA